MFCSQCGTENVASARFCGKCGAGLPGADEDRPMGTTSASPSGGEADAQEFYEAAVGFKNAGFYLPKFAGFDATGGGVSWNWPAFFISFYWLLYRKMWGWSALYFLLPIPVGMGIYFATLESDAAGAVLNGIWLVALFIVFPMYANRIYHRHIEKKILKAKQYTTERDKQLLVVAASGGTSGVALIFVLVFVVAFIGVMAAIAIPAYQDYTIRSMVTQGLNSVPGYKHRIEEYGIANQAWPGSLADIGGIQGDLGPFLSEIEIDENGLLVVTFKGETALDGKSVAFIPGLDDEGIIFWECTGIDMPNRFLPASCRQ